VDVFEWKGRSMSEPISDIAFNSLPQAVKDWIKEIEWKREEIISYHVQHTTPKVVTVFNGKEKQTAQFVILSSGKWKKKA
jgi:hypothetical protein